MLSTSSSVAWAFKDAHARLRAVVEETDADLLNTTLGGETNSIAVLVVHPLGAERQVLGMVAGRAEPRDRDAELRARVEGRPALLDAIDQADRLIDEVLPGVTPEQLARTHQVNDLALPGLAWLLRALGHVREHAAHADLTRQLLSKSAP